MLCILLANENLSDQFTTIGYTVLPPKPESAVSSESKPKAYDILKDDVLLNEVLFTYKPSKFLLDEDDVDIFNLMITDRAAYEEEHIRWSYRGFDIFRESESSAAKASVSTNYP